MVKKKRSISVIIPVFREADRIGETLRHVQEVAGSNSYEICIIDGAIERDTLDSAEGYGAVLIGSTSGRGHQMNVGTKFAAGDILVFLHADTRLPEGAFEEIARILGGDASAGAFRLGFDSDSFAMRWIAFWANVRSALTRAPYGDQVLFFERKFFFNIGGYREIPLMEDLEIMTRVRRLGRRIQISPLRVTSAARRWEQEGKLRCTLRNWAIRLAYHARVSPYVLAQWYSFGGEGDDGD